MSKKKMRMVKVIVPGVAAATIAVIPCVIIFLYSQKYIIEGITFPGMKG